MALKGAAKELIWLQSIFKQFKPLNKIKIDDIYCDNSGAIDLSKYPEHHSRTKHINIQSHYIRECIK